MIFVGVDIGSCAVKAVAIKRTGKTFNIIQTHFFPIKADENEEQKRLLKLSYLKTLSDLYPSREARYIFCLPQKEVSTEAIHFPFKERYKILKSLPYEMEEKLSLFDYDTLISDVKVSPSSKGKNHVLVFSTFKENIANLLNEIRSIGIEPFILTCEASAISNLFETKPENTKNQQDREENHLDNQKESAHTEDCHLYLKVGHSHTTAMIFAQNQLKNVYNFEWGVSSCIRKIATKYEIPFMKAMEQFCEKAFVLTHTRGYTGSQIEFSKIIQESFEHLIDKLRLLLLQMDGDKIYKCKKIFLCGGGTQIRNLQTLLSTHLNIPVSRVEHPPNFSKWNLRNNDENQNNLITALGAAMEGLKKSKRPAINFLKEEFASQFNPFSVTLAQWKEPFLLGVSALILLSFYAGFRNHQSEKLSDKTNKVFQKKSIQMTKLEPKQINTQRVQKFIDSKKRLTKQAQLTEKLSRIPSALDQIKELSIAIKKQESWNLEIQELIINGNKVEIQGEIAAVHVKDLENNLTTLALNGQLKTILKNQIQSTTIEKAPTKETLTKKPEAVHTKNEKESEALITEEKYESKNNMVLFKYSFIQKKG